jgi:hypothetical protein
MADSASKVDDPPIQGSLQYSLEYKFIDLVRRELCLDVLHARIYQEWMQLLWNSDAANTQEAETNPFQISDIANPQGSQTEETIAATVRNNKTITSLLERARSIQQQQKKLKEDIIENGSRTASQPWADVVEKLADLSKIGSDLEQSKVVLEGEWRDLLGKIKKSSERRRGRS